MKEHPSSFPDFYKSIFSQFYKVKSVGKILEDYIHSSRKKYDLVIRTRFDLLYTPINLTTLNPSFFYVEDERHNNPEKIIDGILGTCLPEWLSDKFAICNFDTFMIYSKFYDHLIRLINETKEICPEHFLYLYICKENNRIAVAIKGLHFYSMRM